MAELRKLLLDQRVNEPLLGTGCSRTRRQQASLALSKAMHKGEQRLAQITVAESVRIAESRSQGTINELSLCFFDVAVPAGSHHEEFAQLPRFSQVDWRIHVGHSGLKQVVPRED